MKRRLLPLLTPLPAIAVGAALAAKSGVSLLAFAPSVAAAILGMLAALFLSAPMRRVAFATAIVALALVASTLAFEGVEGVHRWIELGPGKLNASTAFAPLLLMALSQGSDVRNVVLGLLAVAVHLAQPDAGQQTALGLGVAVLLMRASGHAAIRLALGVAVAGSTAWTWARPDPLAPVPHVEQIHELALASGTLWTLALGGALLVLVAPLLTAARREALPAALGAYLVTTLLVPVFGAFPVPVLGAGAGPVLGWYLALGLIEGTGSAARGTSRTEPEATEPTGG